MSRFDFQFGSGVQNTTRGVALVFGVLALAGCQGISGVHPVAQVRVINVSPDSPALDLRQNSQQGTETEDLYNLSFGTVSSYMPVVPGLYSHSVYAAGTQQQLGSVRGNFSNGGQYTVLTGNIAASLQMTLMRDRSTPAPAGQVALRFLHQATRSGPFDIYLERAGGPVTALMPIARAVSFGHSTGYINVPAGTYSVVALPAGTMLSATPGPATSQVAYPAGAVRTLLLVDQTGEQSSGRPVQIITAVDYDPPSAG
jgi:hypothetical protein